MKFADGLVKAYETKWSYINTFRVEFNLPEKLKTASNWSDEIDGKNINLNIISIDTPQFTNAPIEVFVANRWVIHNGRDELYRFTITFRDRDSMSLYRKFLTMYQTSRDEYFDKIKMSIKIFKDADYAGGIAGSELLLFEFSETMIEAVSQLQFNNTTEAQIAEFSVNFKTISPLLQKI